MSLLGLLLMPAGFPQAASMDTFARVHLVQGAQARVESKAAGSSLTQSHGQIQLIVTGPRNHFVDVQLAPLAQDAAWSDSPSYSALSVDSLHNAAGSLVLDLPLNQLEDRSSRYVLSLTYE